MDSHAAEQEEKAGLSISGLGGDYARSMPRCGGAMMRGHMAQGI